MFSVSRALLAVAAAASVASAAQAVTTFTFGQSQQSVRGNTVQWLRTSGASTAANQTWTLRTVPSRNLQPAYSFRLFFPDTSTVLFATRMTIAANSNQAATTSTTNGTTEVVQPLNGGTISFLTTGAGTFKGIPYAAGANVLTVNFTGGAIEGVLGASALAFRATEPGDVITYSSAFTTFRSDALDNFAYSFTSVTPPVGVSNPVNPLARRLTAFRAAATGTFATSVVPEPATWAMLIAGFGMVGFAARRRRALAA